MGPESKTPVPPPAPPANIPPRLRPHAAEESGWTSLRRIVRQADKEKVKECQEKINICLLFFALFSIMLSVFLVSSLQDLYPNYGAQTVELLTQLSKQASSPIELQFRNAADMLAPHAPVVASVTATRVNAWWTASLMTSLAGASLALLFKQSLCIRQYILRNSTSPQADLRARHSHQSEWGVLEIVTFLPLASQIPIALFFAGLCMKTVHVSESAGNIAIGLTVEWVCMLTFIITSTFSFRTPSRLSSMKTRSAKSRSSISWFTSFGRYFPSYTMEIPQPGSLEAALKQTRSAEGDEGDIDVLLAIYADHCEDHVLNIIWDALKDSGAAPEDHLRLVWKLISTTYPSTSSGRKDDKGSTIPAATLDLRSVPNSAYATIMNNIADLLSEEIQRQSGINDSKALEWSPWMREALRLILADSPHPLPSATNSMLATVMNADRAAAFFQVAISSLDGGSSSVTAGTDDFAYMLNRTQGAMQLLKSQDCFECVAALVRYCFCPNEPKSSTCLAVLEQHINDIPPSQLHSVALILLKRLTNDVYPTMFWFCYLVDSFTTLLRIDHALLSQPNKDGRLHRELVKYVRNLLLQPKNTGVYMRFATALKQTAVEEIAVASQLFIDAFVGATSDARCEILGNLASNLEWQQVAHPQETDDDWDSYLRLHIPKTYLLILRAVAELEKQKSPPQKGRGPDKGLRDIVSKLGTFVSYCMRGTVREKLGKERGDSDGSSTDLDQARDGKKEVSPAKSDDDVKTGDTSLDAKSDEAPEASESKEGAQKATVASTDTRAPSAEDIDVAKQCLSLAGTLSHIPLAADTSDEEFAAWVQSFDDKTSFFDGDIIEALGEVLPEEDANVFARLMRVPFPKSQPRDSGEDSSNSTEKGEK